MGTIDKAAEMIENGLDEDSRKTWRGLHEYARNDFAFPVARERWSIKEAVAQFELWRRGGHT